MFAVVTLKFRQNFRVVFDTLLPDGAFYQLCNSIADKGAYFFARAAFQPEFIQNRVGGIGQIVKGVRNGTDTDYELPQAYFNSEKYPQALTVFLPTEENKAQISSTLVRSSAQNSEDYRGLVPQKVYETMMKKQRGDI